MKIKRVIFDEGDLAIFESLFDAVLRATGKSGLEAVNILNSKISNTPFEEINTEPDGHTAGNTPS